MTTTTTTAYTHTTRDNYLQWKRAIDATLDKHHDRLLTIVETKKLHTGRKISLKKEYKQAEMEFNTAAENNAIDDFNKSAYIILRSTISDKNTLRTIERKHPNDGHAAYAYINNQWKADANDDRLLNKSQERNQLIAKGAAGCGLKQMTEFVESLLEINVELDGSEFEMKDNTMVSTVLAALQKYNKPLVTSFKAANTGVADWNKDFDAVWDKLKALLEGDDIADSANKNQTDVLTTNAENDPRDAEIKELKEKIAQLEVLAITGRKTQYKTKLCPACNFPHPPHKVHGCIGEAVSTGKLPAAEAAKLFPLAREPETLVKSAVARYNKHNNIEAKEPPKTFRLEKSVQLMVHTNPIGPIDNIETGFVKKYPPKVRDSYVDALLNRNRHEPDRLTPEGSVEWDPTCQRVGNMNVDLQAEEGFRDHTSAGRRKAHPDPVSIRAEAPHFGLRAVELNRGAAHSDVLACASGGPSMSGMVHSTPRDPYLPARPRDPILAADVDGGRDGQSAPSTRAPPTTSCVTLTWAPPPMMTLSTGSFAPIIGILKFDTQAMDTILCDPRYFPDGVDSNDRRQLGTITPDDGRPELTDGTGVARVKTKSGVEIVIPGAHLYLNGRHNVYATRSMKTAGHEDAGVRLSDGTLLPFDAGYYDMYVEPASATQAPEKNITPPGDTREPDAASAILATGVHPVHFGGITGGPRSQAGMREMTTDEVGDLYGKRTALGARALKELPKSTDAPKRLSELPPLPRNDHDAMRANMPKVPAKAHGSRRSKTICFDLESGHPPSAHAGNRIAVNFYIVHDGQRGSGDDDERHWHVDFLRTKDEFPDRLQDFLQSGDYTGYQLYTDNEIVLNSGKVKGIVRRAGLAPIKNSCEYEPWQNGAVERSWRTLSTGAREFRQRGFGDGERTDGVNPAAYWPYAIKQRADVHNAMHTKGEPGRISHLRVPFCLAYVKTPQPYLADKHAAQAEACMHLGYSSSKPGYVCEVLEGPRKGRVITASQVRFREKVFPMNASFERSAPTPPICWDDLLPEITDTDDGDDNAPSETVDPDGADDDDDDEEEECPSLAGADSDDDDDDDPPVPPRGPARTTRATRSTADVGDWRDVYTALDRGRKEGAINVLYSTSADGARATVPDDKWAPKHFSDIKNIPDTETRNQWYRAHFSENDGLFEKGVLRPVPLPPGMSEDDLLRLRTIYTRKADGRHKARTVLSSGKDKLEELGLRGVRSFAPTARPSTARICCGLSAETDMVIEGGDVQQAYANAKWPEDLKKAIAHLPAGYVRRQLGQLYVAEVGNLYGHVLAGRHWWLTFRKWMLGHGYTQSVWDPCLFYMRRGKEQIWVLCYVDDILTFTTKGSTLRKEFAADFSKDFEWTDFGTDLHEFLSVNIEQKPGEVTLDMERYITDMVTEHFPAGVHHAYSTPAETDLAKFVAKAAAARDDTHANSDISKRFRRMTMQLLYASSQARPDIAIAVSLLTRVQAYASPELLHRAERVLIYLHGTKDLKLTYSKTGNVNTHLVWAPRVTVEGYSDSSWDVAHSTSAYVFRLANATISWMTKKQTDIALSSLDGEVRAGSLAACETIPIRGTMEELGFPQKKPTILFMDSSNAINLAHDPVSYSSSKHIARRDLFIRELVENNVLTPKSIPTAKNVADALTKPLERGRFQEHRAVLFGINDK